MTFAWLEHLFGVGHVGQEVNIPKVIAVVLLVVTFYRMGNGIIFKLFHFCGYHARPFGEEDYRGRTSSIVFFEKRQMPTKYYMISALLDINFFIS